MTKSELVNTITSKVPITNRTASDIIDIISEEIKKELDIKGEVKIPTIRTKFTIK